MGLQLNKGTVNVSGSIAQSGLPSLSPTQTLVSARVSGVSTGTNVYTVTAGKTFYCLGVVFSTAVANSQYLVVNGVSWGVSNCAVNTNISMCGGILFSCAAGQSITLTCNGGAGSGYCAIWGYEA